MKKKLINDLVFNIIATAIPIAVLQLVIYPSIGKRFGDEYYGLFISLISFVTLLAHPFSVSLNNARLLSKDSANKINDFKLILVFILLINLVYIVIGSLYYYNLTHMFFIALITIYSSLYIIYNYGIVAFRIKLNYKMIFFSNLILVIGYVAGYIVFLITGYWQLIFITGLFFSIIHVKLSTSIFSEKIVRTENFSISLKLVAILILSSFLKSSVNYLDKIVLLPLLGASAVTIYYTATFIGKMLSLALTPVSGVILTYLSRMREFPKRQFSRVLVIAVCVSVLAYFTLILISPYILKFFYPLWYEESLKLVNITVLTSIIASLSSLLNPLILKFKHKSYQISLNVIQFILMFLMAGVLFYFFGLVGYALGFLIGQFVSLILSFMVLYFGKNDMQYN